MGMDLKPHRPWKRAPRNPPDHSYDPNGPVWGRYNWSGWGWLYDHLVIWGLPEADLAQFDGCNDGNLIHTKTCQRVVNLIEENLPALDPSDQEWLRPHIERWRTSGGYRQY